MKLKQFSEGKSTTDIAFTRIEKFTTAATGEKMFWLYLTAPISEVPGSGKIPDEAAGIDVPIVAYDVDKVLVHDSLSDDEGWDITDPKTGAGTYKGELFLDVAKSTYEVKLVDEPLANYGKNKRKEETTKKNSGLLALMRTKAAEKAAGKVVTPIAKQEQKAEAEVKKPLVVA